MSSAARRGLARFLATWALAVLVRVLMAWLAPPPPIMEGLTHKYLVCAGHFLHGEGFMQQVSAGAEVPYVDRLPGYILVLAALKLLGLGSLGALSLAHGVLGALQAPILGALGRRLLGARAGLAAGLAWALFPPAWAADLQVLETGLTGVALALTAWALARHVERVSWGSGWLLALCGSAALALRADNMLVPAASCSVALLLIPRRRWPTLLPALLLPLLLLLPWGLRNARVADRFFVSAGLGTNLLEGYAEFSRNPEAIFGDRALARSEGHESLYWPEPGARDARRRDRALRFIASDPGGWLVGCLRRVPILLSLHAGELWPGGPGLKEQVARWREDHPEAARFEGLLAAASSHLREHPLRAAATLAWGPLLLGFAVAGAFRLRRAPHLLLLLLWSPVYGLAVHLPLHAEPRYFLPHAGLLAVLAAGLLVRPREAAASARVEEEDGRPRLLALLGAVEDARCRRRLLALSAEGFAVRALGFRRDDELAAVPPLAKRLEVEELGRLPHGRYGLRLLRYALAWPRVAAAAWRSDAVLAFGSDLAGLAAASMPGATPLVVEIADVREALMGEGRRSRLLRRLERRSLERAALVVTTSEELAARWLVERQGLAPGDVQVIENKLDGALPPRPSGPRASEGPLTIGWTGLLRCGRSWAVLREAAARGGGRLRVVLHGIARGLPRLEQEARDAPHVEWRGPFASPEDLGRIHAELDASWIAHAHGAANSLWARANRFHEAAWFGTPLIAQAGTPDGRSVAAEGLGPVIDLADPEAAVERLLALERAELRAFRERLLALPPESFRCGAEHAELARRIRSAIGSPAVKERGSAADETGEGSPA